MRGLGALGHLQGDVNTLVAKLLDGDEAAFSELVREHHSSMVRVARHFVGSVAVAEEVAQETWEAVLDGLATFERRSSLRTWIFRILVNRARTRGQREGRTIAFSALAAPGEDVAVDPGRFDAEGMWKDPPTAWAMETPEAQTLNAEAMDALGHALEELPPSQRAVVTLRDIEGLDADEVCNVLEISESNQRVLLHRGRAKLRAALERFYGRTGR